MQTQSIQELAYIDAMLLWDSVSMGVPLDGYDLNNLNNDRGVPQNPRNSFQVCSSRCMILRQPKHSHSAPGGIQLQPGAYVPGRNQFAGICCCQPP